MLGRVTDVNDLNDDVAEYDYNGNGKLKDIKDPNENITSYDYDNEGRLDTQRIWASSSFMMLTATWIAMTIATNMSAITESV